MAGSVAGERELRAYVLAGGGEMGERMRALDWGATPLGEVSTWSPALRMIAGFLLVNRFPLLLWWGPELVQFYNDPYVPILGAKHPHALGQRGEDCWREIWDTIGPLIRGVLAGGPPAWIEDLPLPLVRHGFPEEAYFTFAHSPVPDHAAPGGVGGVMATVYETTAKVIGERRTRLLRDLGAAAVHARSAQAARRAIQAVLRQDRLDLPFASVSLDSDPAAWERARRRAQTRGLRVRLLPLRGDDPARPRGALVVGLSPRLRDDAAYHAFLDLVAGQSAAAVASAAAFAAAGRRADALAELDRAKTAFFTNISHEFRTPLTLLLGPLQQALARPHLDPDARLDLESALRNARRLLKLVNNLLDFSRLEAGRLQPRLEPTDLAAFTADLANTFRAAAEAAGLRFDIAVPPSARGLMDRGMWETIVFNLLSNAVKYTLAGGVALRLRAEGASAILEISDTGVGIPATELPRLFDRFHRVESAAGRSIEGTGIGLALTHELVQLLGGTVAVHSRVGQGTQFTVTVPLPPAAAPAASPPAPALVLPVRDPPRPSSGPRVLLAEDNPDMRDYIVRLLAPHYRVATAGRGDAALAAALAQPPDLVLTDVVMSGLDGFQLLRALRADPRTRSVPVIMLSARAGSEAQIEGLEAGADDYLVKPFHARELLARVATQAHLQRLRRERNLIESWCRTVLDAVAEGVVLVDWDWNILFANRQLADLARRAPDDLIGQNFWQAFPDVRGTVFEPIYRRAHAERRRLQAEGFYEPLRLWARVQTVPIEQGLSFFVQDVTAQHRQQEQLLVSEKLAATGRMAATLAHEINNPLAAAVNALYLIRNGGGDAPKFAAIAEREVNRVARLARQAMGLYRSGSAPMLADPAALLDDALEAFEARFRARGIEVARDFAPVPQVELLRGELDQVALHLLANALDAMPHGGRLLLRLAPALRAGQAGVEITVADSGPGIPAAARDHVFDPFFTTKPALGTGLGLWVVRRIVANHHGDVTLATSTAPHDHGTRVSLFLPLRPPRPLASTPLSSLDLAG